MPNHRNSGEILKKRFFAKVRKEPSGCWVWIGNRNWCGYGYICINFRRKRAHRVSWEIHNGPIPEGKKVLHKCDNPPCVNPNHLMLGTQEENCKDMWRKGRGIPPATLTGEAWHAVERNLPSGELWHKLHGR